MTEPVEFEYSIDMSKVDRALGRYPSAVRRAAGRARAGWSKTQTRMANDARAASKAAEKAWSDASDGMTDRIDDLIPSFGGLGTSIAQVGKAAGPTGVAVAGVVAVVTAGVGAVHALSTEMHDYVREVDAAASRTGLTRDEIVGLRAAASAASADQEKLVASTQKLAEQLDNAALGSADALVALQALGFTEEELATRSVSTGEALRRVIGELGAMEDPTRVAQLQVRLLGEAGVDLVDALDGSADTLDLWTDKARAAGATIDADAVAATEKWDKASTELDLAVQGLKNTLGAELLPIVADYVTDVSDAVDSTEDWQTRLNGILDLVAPLSSLAGFANVATDAYGLMGDGADEAADGIDGITDAMGRLGSSDLGADDLFPSVSSFDPVLDEQASPVPQVGEDDSGDDRAAARAAADARKRDAARLAALGRIQDATDRYTMSTLEGADLINAKWDAEISNLLELGKVADNKDATAEAIAAAEAARAAELAALHEEEERRAAAAQAAALERLNGIAVGHLTGMDAINAKYQREMELIDELEEKSGDAAAAQEARDRATSERTEAIRKLRLDAAQEWLGITGDVVSSIGGLVDGLYAGQIASAREGSKEQKRLLRAQFKAQKGFAIAQASINLAQGVLQALANFPPPVSFVMAGLQAALGGVQIGLIASQKMPSFDIGGMARGGMLGSSSHMAPDQFTAQLKDGEGVLTRQGVAAAGGPSGVHALNRGQHGGMPVIVQTYGHRVYDDVTSSSLRAPSSPLSRAIREGNRVQRRMGLVR
jgi:hypothetical protein